MKIRTNSVDWEQEYQKSELWEKKPHTYSIIASKYVRQGKVLDIGCGEGHDCLYFASKGYDVTGVDISASALDRMLDDAKKHNLELKTIKGDVNTLKIKDNFDIITSYGVLQFLGQKFDNHIEKLKAKTNPGGIHSMYLFGDSGNFYDIAKHKFAFPSIKMLKELYHDWNIIDIESKNIELLIKGDNGETLHNALHKILAKTYL